MEQQKTSSLLRERREHRLSAMRLGQAACEIFVVPSDPEVRMAMVPLLESEYLKTLRMAASEDLPVTDAGNLVRDEFQRVEVLAIALREMDDLSTRVFNSSAELQEVLEVQDINVAWDTYLEMVNQQSPAIEMVPEEDFEELKKVFGTIRMSELSGPQWYALMRFLRLILPNLLTGNSLGLSSTSTSILTSDDEEFISNAYGSSTKNAVKSVESPSESQE